MKKLISTTSGALVLGLGRHLAHALEPGECPHCGMINCTMEHVKTSSGEQMMIMGGLPLWLFLVGVGLIIILSFVATEWLAPKSGPGFRRNLIKNRRVYAVVRSRWFQAVPQLIMAGILGLLIYVGLFGSRVANLTPVAVWTIWWGALVFTVLLFASAWCFVCPWDGLANLASRLRLAARVEPLGLGLRYPRWLANVYPAIALFVILTWLELGYGVTTNPRHTAYMGIAMIGLAVLGALLFDGKKFCAHGCPVGRICGIYSTVAPVEIRARKPAACKTCKTEDCLNGNENGYPCPTGISLKTTESSADCTMCTECIKSCKRHNVALNLRPFGAGLRNFPVPRLDQAWLCLTLLALTLFHGLTMTPVWEDFRPGSESILKWIQLELGVSHVASFTLAMVVFCAAPIVAYGLSCKLGAWWANHDSSGLPRLLVLDQKHDERPGAGVLFRAFAFSLLPVALFYHLAHNLMHLAMEGGHVIPMLSDPMGDGSNYLGTAGHKYGHLINEQTLWYMQIGLILLGHIIGIVVAHRVAHRLYSDKRAAVRSLVPMLVLMIALSVAGLWLMHVDMNMRVGRM
jgi:hypothetical protein